MAKIKTTKCFDGTVENFYTGNFDGNETFVVNRLRDAAYNCIVDELFYGIEDEWLNATEGAAEEYRQDPDNWSKFDFITSIYEYREYIGENRGRYKHDTIVLKFKGTSNYIKWTLI